MLTSFQMENTSLLDLPSSAPGKFPLLSYEFIISQVGNIIHGKQNNEQPV